MKSDFSVSTEGHKVDTELDNSLIKLHPDSSPLVCTYFKCLLFTIHVLLSHSNANCANALTALYFFQTVSLLIAVLKSSHKLQALISPSNKNH